MTVTRTSTRMPDDSTGSLSPKRLRGVCRSWTQPRLAFAWTIRSRSSFSTCINQVAFVTLSWAEKSAPSFAMKLLRTQKFSRHEQRRHSFGGRDVDGKKRRLHGARICRGAHGQSLAWACGKRRRSRVRIDDEAQATRFDHHTRAASACGSTVRRRDGAGHRESVEGIEDRHYTCG